ncbi:MAG TPA: choice-of-anchor D domain-containing protein, partial [Terriglobales bacterium]|nr:choice-of-anchor D domain-containing protein [Terriglobales bacterium]
MRHLRWVGASLGLGLVLGLRLAGQAFQPAPAIHTVFLIVMENLQWADVEGSPDAPYINQTLLPQAAHAEQYLGEPYLHPSLPNYLVLEAGTNFGIQDDLPPAINQQNTTQHLTAALEAAGLVWKAWVEDISGNNCPLVDVNLYTDAVNPTVFFGDVINSASNCIAHERPFGELAAALNHNTVPNLNWIIPDLCDDAHSCPLSTGDQWLSQVVPMIQASQAYQAGGAIFITWDEDQDGVEDQPLGLLIASPAAKPGYFSSLPYTHASTLRTIEEIFHLSPYFGEAAAAPDLSDLFNTSGLALSPQSLTFAPQPLGATSPPQTVAVNNQGSIAVTITGVAASGDFTQTNDCPASLAPQASCSITVQFTPQSTSQEQGQLSLDDDSPGSPQQVRLSGQGQGGIAQLSTASLDFGTVTVGQTSAPQPMTLANVGGAALALGAIQINGPFSQSGHCPAALAAGASCVLQVRFTPSAAQTSHGQLSFNDNASDSPQQVNLRGTGQGALALISAETLHWGNQAVGSSSSTQTLTLQNGGNIPLAVASITVSGPFSLVSGCAATLAPGTLCGLHVQFVPQVPGPAAGALTVTDNAPDSPQQVMLSATGQGAVALLSPATLTWAAQALGTASPAQTLTLQNQGNIPLALNAVGVTGPFSLVNGCGASLAPGAQCALQVQFTPLAPGPAAGSLTLTYNAPGSPQPVPLSGTGDGAVVLFSPATLNLGAQAVGGASPAQTLSLQNLGNIPLALSAVAVTGPFSLVNGCGTSLAAGAQCALQVQFTPQAPGPATGSLAVTDNAPGSPQQVVLSGAGQGALALLSAATLDAGAQAVGSASPAQTLTLQNQGNIPLMLNAVAVTGPFSLVNGCGTSLAAGAQCALQVQFTPQAPGPATGSLAVT